MRHEQGRESLSQKFSIRLALAALATAACSSGGDSEQKTIKLEKGATVYAKPTSIKEVVGELPKDTTIRPICEDARNSSDSLFNSTSVLIETIDHSEQMRGYVFGKFLPIMIDLKQCEPK